MGEAPGSNPGQSSVVCGLGSVACGAGGSFGGELEGLSKGKLKSLLKAVSSVIKKKYKTRKITKYGNLNKGFTDSELRRFFSCCTHKKAYLAFFLMANLGLRVGEVVRIKLSDINFNGRKIRIETEKAGTTDFLYLHNRVQELLLDWVQKFQDKIVDHNSYVLFSDNPKQQRAYISPHWLRKEFRQVCILANLNETYGNAEDSSNKIRRKDGEGRYLYRLTTHSLRHYYITRVFKNCKNPIVTQRLARHQDFKSTQTYINITQEEIDKTLQDVFGEEITAEENKEMESMIEFFTLWKQMKELKKINY